MVGHPYFRSIQVLSLLLEEAGLEDDAAAINLTINLLWVVGKLDALYLCASLDNHRRALNLEVLDNCHSVAIAELCAVAVACNSVCLSALLAWVELVTAVRTYI